MEAYAVQKQARWVFFHRLDVYTMINGCAQYLISHVRTYVYVYGISLILSYVRVRVMHSLWQLNIQRVKDDTTVVLCVLLLMRIVFFLYRVAKK